MMTVRRSEKMCWLLTRRHGAALIDDITMDLVVDENSQVLESVPTAGWWGNLESNDVWPFILKKGGVLNFSSNDEEPAASDERFGSLSIGGKTLTEGVMCHFCYGDIPANMNIVQFQELGSSS